MRTLLFILFMGLTLLGEGQPTPIYKKAKWRISTVTAPPPSEDYVGTHSPSIAVGSYAADALAPHFTNSAGTYDGSSFTTAGKFYTTISSTHQSRDQTFKGYFQTGFVQLRSNDSGSLYMYYKAGQNGGTLWVGYAKANAVFSINNENYENTTAQGLDAALTGASWWQLDNINSTYSIDGSQDFEFGADGFRIWVKYGSQYILDQEQTYHLSAGKIAFKGWYVSRMVTTFTARTLLASNTDLRRFNSNDLVVNKISNFQTTGSFSSDGSSTLIVADASGISVGTNLIVATGGEDAYYGRQADIQGGSGVNGHWPEEAQMYETDAARMADTTRLRSLGSSVDGYMMGVRVTGEVWQWQAEFGGYFERMLDLTYAGAWYMRYLVPRGYRGKVLAKNYVSGQWQLTMSLPCKRKTTYAKVYFDNAIAINNLFRSGAAGTVGVGNANRPAAFFFDVSGYVPISEVITLDNRSGWEFYGRGASKDYYGNATADSTVFFTPRGIGAARITLNNSVGAILHDIGSTNTRDANDAGWSDVQWNFNMAQYGSFPSFLSTASPGITVNASNYAKVYNFSIRNGYTGIFSFSNSKYVNAYDGYVEFNHDAHGYFAWAMVMDNNSSNDTARRIRFNAKEYIGAFEAFGSDFCSFDSLYAINASCSNNSSGAFSITNSEFHYTPNSNSSWVTDDKYGISFNGNAYGARKGGLVDNCKFYYYGNTPLVGKPKYFRPAVNVVVTDSVQVKNSQVILVGDFANQDSIDVIAFRSTGTNTLFENLTVSGWTYSSYISPSWNSDYNINMTGTGIIRNCTAGSIFVSNTTDVQVLNQSNIATKYFQIYGQGCGTIASGGCTLNF